MKGEIERRIRDRGRSLNGQKIQNPKYNPFYKESKTEQGRAQYLMSREIGQQEKMLLARYCTGDGSRGGELLE